LQTSSSSFCALRHRPHHHRHHRRRRGCRYDCRFLSGAWTLQTPTSGALAQQVPCIGASPVTTKDESENDAMLIATTTTTTTRTRMTALSLTLRA
jgi:hypothetical protein